MTLELVNKWLEKLRESWLNKEGAKASELFRHATFYQETPFITPYTKYEEILKEWDSIDNQNIKN